MEITGPVVRLGLPFVIWALGAHPPDLLMRPCHDLVRGHAIVPFRMPLFGYIRMSDA